MIHIAEIVSYQSDSDSTQRNITLFEHPRVWNQSRIFYTVDRPRANGCYCPFFHSATIESKNDVTHFGRCAFTVEPVYYGHLGTSQKCPDYQGVLIFHMIMYHLGPQLGVWIMQVSTFSSVLINRFHLNGFMCSDPSSERVWGVELCDTIDTIRYCDTKRYRSTSSFGIVGIDYAI